MMTQNLVALVRYRIEQADEALDAARILLREGSLRASVNRSYYAMFYAVLALLAGSFLGQKAQRYLAQISISGPERDALRGKPGR